MKRVYYLLFAVLFFLACGVLMLSCGNEGAKGNVPEQATPIITWDTSAAFFIDSIIESDALHAPRYIEDDEQRTTIKFPWLIIGTSEYHGDEITEAMKQADWYALFKQNGRFILEKSDVSFTHVYDGIMDDDTTTKSGYAVKDTHEGAIFISNAGPLQTGEMNSADLDTNIAIPGKSIYFDYGGIHYRLYASAYRRKERPDEEYYSIRNYRCYLQANDSGKITTQLLDARPYLEGDYNYTNILFAGDMDKDNKPDLVLGVPIYNGYFLLLFLSGNAEKGELLKLNAMHESTGC